MKRTLRRGDRVLYRMADCEFPLAGVVEQLSHAARRPGSEPGKFTVRIPLPFRDLYVHPIRLDPSGRRANSWSWPT